MKSTVFFIIVSVCIGPSLCAWGRPRASKSSTTTTSLTSPLPPSSSSRMGLERRVGKPDDEKDYEDGGSLELDGIESTVINGTDQEERFFNKFPLHVFMKKKRPFVSFSTVTQTSTITALVTSSTVGLCAKLVNVTGACRLRRGMWVDDPIVLSFDDDMDSIDEALSPSKTLSIETTSVPEAMAVAQGRSSTGDEVIQNGARDRRISVRSGSVIHSSKEEEVGGESRDDDDVQESRFGFFGLKKKIKNKMKFITVITTTLVTSTSTSTYYVTISTKTFYIQLCTPSPFPFNICQGRKKRQLEIELPLSSSKSANQKEKNFNKK